MKRECCPDCGTRTQQSALRSMRRGCAAKSEKGGASTCIIMFMLQLHMQQFFLRPIFVRGG
jgi:hypothetical protein